MPTRSDAALGRRRRLSCCLPYIALFDMAARSALRYVHLPRLVPYSIGLELQQTLVARRVAALQRATPAQPAPDEDVLLLLEHRPVYTAGRRETDEATLGAEGARLRAFGADYVPTQRGGQTTYHGPGQLVGYPIVDLNAQNVRPLVLLRPR